jgi:hypothetical protein
VSDLLSQPYKTATANRWSLTSATLIQPIPFHHT